MDKANQEELRRWVEKQTASLTPPPAWQPDSTAALARFHTRIEANRPRAIWTGWPALATAAALIAAVTFLFPVSRIAAQQLWQFLTVRKVAFIHVGQWPKGVPSPELKLGIFIPPSPARDTEQAGWRVHYEPRLPRPGVLSGAPRLSTTLSLSAGTVIKTADLELALRSAGVTGMSVPSQWDGAKLALHTSAVVIAEWPDVLLAQSLPLTLTAPAGFDFPAFSTLLLRVLGVGPEQAQRLAQQMGTVPPWLAPITKDMERNATIQEIALNSGPATLIQEPRTDGSASRVTIIWTVPDRVFLLSGYLNRELTIATANAIQ